MSRYVLLAHLVCSLFVFCRLRPPRPGLPICIDGGRVFVSTCIPYLQKTNPILAYNDDELFSQNLVAPVRHNDEQLASRLVRQMGPSGGRSRTRKACHWDRTAPHWEAIACKCALRSNFDVSRGALDCACGCQSCVCSRNEFSFSTTKCMVYRFSEHGGCRRMSSWMQTFSARRLRCWEKQWKRLAVRYTRNLSDLEFVQALSVPSFCPFAVIFACWASGYQAFTIAPSFFKSCPSSMITSLGAAVPRTPEGSADFPKACLNCTYIWISNISSFKTRDLRNVYVTLNWHYR